MGKAINIFQSLETGFIGLCLVLDSVVYGLISKSFELFTILANATVFDNEIINDIMYKSYALVGIIMLFVLVFAIIQNIFNPENAFSGDKGMNKVAKNVVKALILVALVPVLFDLGYNLQNAIISDNIFGKIFFGSDMVYGTLEVETGEYNEEGEFIATGQKQEIHITGQDELIAQGSEIAFYVYNGFLNPEGRSDYEFDAGKYEAEAAGWDYVFIGTCVAAGLASVGAVITSPVGGLAALGPGAWLLWASCFGSGAIAVGHDIANLWTLEEYTWQKSVGRAIAGDFKGFVPFADIIVEGEMTYAPIVSTIAGLVLLYIIFSFCLDLGVRAVKLAFYEMIAPIPIFLSTLPGKEDLLKNWAKATLATFMEVIVRILIIYLIVYFASNISLNIKGLGLIQAILIMGVVIFAKQLPKILSDITGIDSGNIKLGIREKLADGGLFTVGAALGSSATSAIRNAHSTWKNTGRIDAAARSFIGGAGSGLIRGGKAGLKAKSFSEMKNSAGEGAAATTAARDRRDLRGQNRKEKFKATMKAVETGGFKEGIKELAKGPSEKASVWISGGVAAYEEIIKKSREMKAKFDAMDDEAAKLVQKNLFDRSIIAGVIKNQSDFKGDQKTQGILYNLYNSSYVGKSLDAIRQDIDIQKQKTNFKNEKDRLDHSQKMADLENMYAQLLKAGKKNVLNHGIAKQSLSTNLDLSKLSEITTIAGDFTSMYNELGGIDVDPVTGDPVSSIPASGDIAKSMDDIATAFQHKAQKAQQDVANIKKREQEKQGK